MITRTLLAAIFAGLLAGFVMSVVQHFKVVPNRIGRGAQSRLCWGKSDSGIGPLANRR